MNAHLQRAAAGRALAPAVALALLAAAGAPRPAAGQAAVRLATGGAASLDVVTASNAPAAVAQAADELALCLGRIAGASFARRTGDGATGLAVGTRADFPAVAFPDAAAGDRAARERYVLRSHAAGVYLVGATEAAVRHAVWDFLYRLGYRQFFPGPRWEIVPRTPDLEAALDVAEEPDYAGRSIWFGYGSWPAEAARYRTWCARNRMSAGPALNTGHAYEAIIARNKAAFDAHPEFLGLLDGKRTSSKICIGNPAVRALMAEDALRQFREKPGLETISIEPSDGGGWCECERCAALGSITDRQVTLANEVAAGVGAEFPGKAVCFYAYSRHSPPPTIAVASNVIVSIATAFVTGGYTVDQLFEGWGRAHVRLGVREYYGVNVWDRDLPGRGRGGNTTYLRSTIPRFHAAGARYMSAESSDNWGPNGLGYYLASRMLWDTNEAARVEALTDEFLALCFGPAREPMREFYRLLDGGRKQPVTDDLLGRLYRALEQARTLAQEPAIRDRLADLAGYVRYVELFRAFQEAPRGEAWSPKPLSPDRLEPAPKTARQLALEALIRHVYRIRDTQMIHSLGLLRDLRWMDGSVWLPEEARFDAPETVKRDTPSDPLEEILGGEELVANPWKKKEPFAEPEIARLVSEGVARHPLLDFEPVAFGTDLVPAAPLGLAAAPAPSGERGSTETRGHRDLYFWSTNAPFTLTLTVTAGLIYDIFGDTVVQLFPADDPTGAASSRVEIKPDKQEREVRLASRFTGLHRLEWDDRAAKTRIAWPGGFAGTWPASEDVPFALAAAEVFFYVPRGTRVIGGRTNGTMTFVDPDGGTACEVKDRASLEYFSLPVPPGADGKVWRIRGFRGGSLALLTVPPCVAFDPAALLLPREVVEADAAPTPQ